MDSFWLWLTYWVSRFRWWASVRWSDIELFLYGLLWLTVVAVLSWFIARRVILASLTHIISRTQNEFDDVLLEKKVLSRLSHLAPAVVIHEWAPQLFRTELFTGAGRTAEEAATRSAYWTGLVQDIASLYMLVVGLLTIYAVLDAVTEAYHRAKRWDVPIRGFIQATKIIVFFVIAVMILSTLTEKSPAYFFTGLGAVTAVLLLIFKDSILGLVAGIQIATNRLLSKGDWIAMPQYGADGNVLDISLNTVRVQNWDMTITTIPTYALVSQSFKNWRGMSESGGRRIKRQINIDMNTVKFCDEEMIERFRKIRHISEYIEMKRQEVASYNQELEVDDECLVNGRRLTNLGTFRAYVKAYLENHPKVHRGMTLLVRQLAPGDNGIPIELYVFSAEQAWVAYEGIQGDIFDHLIASLREFDLRVFQNPTGRDLEQLTAPKN